MNDVPIHYLSEDKSIDDMMHILGNVSLCGEVIRELASYEQLDDGSIYLKHSAEGIRHYLGYIIDKLEDYHSMFCDMTEGR